MLTSLATRADTFRNKVICADQQMELACPKSQRLLIYSAFFGTAAQPLHECGLHRQPPPAGSAEPSKKPAGDLCQAQKANELTMSRCQGQKQCRLWARFDEFDWPPCARQLDTQQRSTQLHLKVTYNCVPKEVLRDAFLNSNSSSRNRGNTNNNNGNSGSSFNSSSNTPTSVLRRPEQPNRSPPATSAQLIPPEAGQRSTERVAPPEPATEAPASRRKPAAGVGQPAVAATEDYSGFVDAPRYNPNETPGKKPENSESRTAAGAEPETAANYKTNQLDAGPSPAEAKQENIGFVSEWLSAYKYIERKFPSACRLNPAKIYPN